MSTAVQYATVLDALANAPAARRFMVEWCDDREESTVTFGEFTRLAERKARQLREHGLGAGETVIIIARQTIDAMAAFVGAMMVGGTPALLPFPNDRTEPSKYRAGLAGVSGNLRARLTVIDDELPANVWECVAVGGQFMSLSSADAARAVSTGGWSLPALDSESLALIQHSSGTTGLQKGVALSHGSILRQVSHLREAQQIGDGDSVYTWLPFYHDMGLIGCFLHALVCHIPIVMQTPTEWVRRPAAMLELITRYRCTIAFVPNFALQFLATRVPFAERGRYDLRSLRCLVNASEPVRAHSIDTFVKAFQPSGLPPDAIQTAYGMAENTLLTTHSSLATGPPRLWVHKGELGAGRAREVDSHHPSAVCLVSSGRCLRNNTVKVQAAAGSDAADGEVGEILVQSDSMFDGYLNQPQLTAGVMRDGWYCSRDLGFMWGGELFVIGRRDDIIIAAGTNVNPVDIEEITCSHALIRPGRAIALGVDNEDLGTQEVVIVAEVRNDIDLRDAATIARAIRQSVVDELGVSVRRVHIKPPGWIVKSTAGKPARKDTREKLMQEHAGEFDQQDVATGV